MRLSLPITLVSITALSVAPGCGGGGEETPSSSASNTGTGAGGAGGAGGSSASSTGEGGGFNPTTTGTGGAGGGGDDTCVAVQCDPDQHCEPQDGKPVCVDNTCADLTCSPTEICETTPGGGAICKDIGCATDVECPVSQYCNGTICVDDACAAGAQTCVGEELHECSPNGSGDVVKYACGSQSYYTSMCADPGMGDAACPCEDDWDCPEHTVCDVGKCTGTGKAPTCTLPPEPFQNVLPKKEIQWGGTGNSATALKAVNAPFPSSSQASVTPIVVNLDDDNGDGLINELDFAEIVFMTYCSSAPDTNGTIRAIHGGGPNKGKDYFATCGSTVWHQGDNLAMPCTCDDAIGNGTSVVAAGDLDGDGVPEILAPTENDGIQILSNKGDVIATSAGNQWPTTYSVPAVTIANLDNKGFAEIIVGAKVFTVAHDANGALVFVDKFDGALMQGIQSQGPVSCVANIAGDSRQEIIAGTTVYAFPEPPMGVTKRSECAAGAMDDFCTGKLKVVWDGQTVNGTAKISDAKRDGFCAIADILGADEVSAPGPANPPNGKAEVILVNDGFLLILNGEDGTLRRSINLGVGTDGGAPNVDDFDGDGFPEVGSAFSTRYMMMDLQEPTTACPAWPNGFSDGQTGLQGNTARSPGGVCTMDSECAAGAFCNKVSGSCVCLHNGWARITEDDSSKVTGSSVFDFNGDGAAEVIYNDECYFRIYDGITSDVLFKHNSPSRTRIESPAIADVDNDGNAEIVFASNNDSNSCSVGDNHPNGIAVWGDDSDTWVSARRIWNQHAYHVTNITEGGGVPVKEPESWKLYNKRLYNTYRSNPRSAGVAPDLTIKGAQITSPDAACGQLSKNTDISLEITNTGDLRVGPGVVVTFYGEWPSPALNEPLYANIMQVPLTAILQSSIEPGGSALLTVSYNAANNAPNALPATVRVVVDEADKERECNEANNELKVPVDPGVQQADLRVQLGLANAATCPVPQVETTVINDGSAPASDILVRYYAGDPNQGGTAIHDEIVAGPLAAGAMTTFNAKIMGFPANLSILLYAVVDANNAIKECNDGNNKDAAENKVICNTVN